MTSQQATRPSYGEQPRPQMVEFLPRSAARVLDVGCNNGAFGAEIKRQRTQCPPAEKVAGVAG